MHVIAYCDDTTSSCVLVSFRRFAFSWIFDFFTIYDCIPGFENSVSLSTYICMVGVISLSSQTQQTQKQSKVVHWLQMVVGYERSMSFQQATAPFPVAFMMTMNSMSCYKRQISRAICRSYLWTDGRHCVCDIPAGAVPKSLCCCARLSILQQLAHTVQLSTVHCSIA